MITILKGLGIIAAFALSCYLFFILCGIFYVVFHNLFSSISHISHNYRNYEEYGWNGTMWIFIIAIGIGACYGMGYLFS